MPACGTHQLRRLPVVVVAVGGCVNSRVHVVVRLRFAVCAGGCAVRDTCGRHAQVRLGPALLADLHRGIHVALVVGHRRGAWAGLCITCGDTAETHFRAVGGASRRGHERTVGVAGAGGKAREVVGHRLARGVHRHVSTARSGFPLETLCDNSHVGGVGYITVQRGGGGGDICGGRRGHRWLHVGCAAASFIAEATNRKTDVAAVAVAPVHAGVGVAQAAVPRDVRTVLRRGSEEGVETRTAETVDPAAGGNGPEARSVIVGVCGVAGSTRCG